MKLIGFSRTPFSKIDFRCLYNVLTTRFGSDNIRESADADHTESEGVRFDPVTAEKRFSNANLVGFYKHNTFGAILNNQAFRRRDLIYPHSNLVFETSGDDTEWGMSADKWLELSQVLTDSLHLEIAIVLGKDDRVVDYFSTPLSVGIGLIDVYWIMCFGQGYSDLIQCNAVPSAFYLRTEFGARNLKSFVTTREFCEHRNRQPQLISRQRSELGEKLFHRMPRSNELMNSGVRHWVGDTKLACNFMKCIVSGFLSNHRNSQALVVPSYYQR